MGRDGPPKCPHPSLSSSLVTMKPSRGSTSSCHAQKLSACISAVTHFCRHCSRTMMQLAPPRQGLVSEGVDSWSISSKRFVSGMFQAHGSAVPGHSGLTSSRLSALTCAACRELAARLPSAGARPRAAAGPAAVGGCCGSEGPACAAGACDSASSACSMRSCARATADWISSSEPPFSCSRQQQHAQFLSSQRFISRSNVNSHRRLQQIC